MLVCLGTYVLASRSDGCTMLLHDVSHEEEEHACHMRRRIPERPLLGSTVPRAAGVVGQYKSLCITSSS